MIFEVTKDKHKDTHSLMNSLAVEKDTIPVVLHLIVNNLSITLR